MNSISSIYIYIVHTLFVVIMKQLNKLGKLLLILPQTKAHDERNAVCVACGTVENSFVNTGLIAGLNANGN